MKEQVELRKKKQFSPRDYDKLESELRGLSSQTEILRKASYWITSQFDCKFVLFYADQGKSSQDRVKYYGEQVHSLPQIGSIVEERMKVAPSTEGLYKHACGALSVPVSYSGFLRGYLFIGANKDGVPYDETQQKVLGPVNRIINHALLAFDAQVNREEKNRLR